MNSDVGFRFVNGVMKGGSYLDGNRCDYNRSSYRLYTGKTVKYEMRGFRFVMVYMWQGVTRVARYTM